MKVTKKIIQSLWPSPMKYITKRRFSLPVLLYRKLTREKSHFIRKRAFVKKCCEKFRFFRNFWKNTEHKNGRYRYKQYRFWRNEIFGSSIWPTETPVGQVSSLNDRSLSEKLIKRKLEKIESSFLSITWVFTWKIAIAKNGSK